MGEKEKITDAELLKIVKQFRKGILGKKRPHKWCFALSAPLQGYLSVCGIDCVMEECEIEQGEDVHDHWYLNLLDGRIIDATASQFYHPETKETLPDVYIGEKPSFYQAPKKYKLTRNLTGTVVKS